MSRLFGKNKQNSGHPRPPGTRIILPHAVYIVVALLIEWRINLDKSK